jgi:uncharacterized protein YqeY
MSLIEQLKQESLSMRKAKHELAVFMSFVLSEVEKVGKDKRNDNTTDDEAISVIRKIIERNKELFGPLVQQEIALLQKFLPIMVSQDTIAQEVDNYVVSSEKPNKGELMKMLKARHGNLIDLKLAGSMFDARLNQ